MRIIQNEDGFVLPFVAILLMVLFFVGGIILDTGSVYLRHGELQHLAKQSANAGMLKFVEALEERAEVNKLVVCGGDEPPPVCESENMFDFLVSGEIVDLVSSPTIQVSVQETSLQFGISYDPQLILINQSVQIVFPYEQEGISEIQIQVTLQDTPHRFLGGIFPLIDNDISVSAVGYIATPF